MADNSGWGWNNRNASNGNPKPNDGTQWTNTQWDAARIFYNQGASMEQIEQGIANDRARSQVHPSPEKLARMRAGAAGAGGAAGDGAGGNYDYDPATGQWSIYNGKDKGWTSYSRDDIANHLSDQMKAAHPDWYWGQFANQSDDQYQYQQTRDTNQAQQLAGLGQTVYKGPQFAS